MKENQAIDQNFRMREWFKQRTGLDTDFLNDHMEEIDRLLGGNDYERKNKLNDKLNPFKIITYVSTETILSGDFEKGSLRIKFFDESGAPSKVSGIYKYTNEERKELSEICNGSINDLKDFVEKMHTRIRKKKEK